MKIDFQPNEVLTAEALNANFEECAGKANAEHSHSYIRGAQVALDAEEEIHIEVGDSHELDINESNFDNLERALSNPDTIPTEDSDNLIKSGGVYGALSGKFNKSDIKTAASFPTSDAKVLSEKAVVNYIDNAIQPGGVINLGDLQPSNPLNIDVEWPDPTEGFHYGRLLFFTNNLGGVASALNELLVSNDEGREIHFHLNAADLQKRCNMIRVFKFAPDHDDPTRFEYFVEVAGAWDFEQ
ncbi:MAG: hypothetical protein MJZ64_00315 [Paludibacteraceae bacterium]|nr:hypothetical protein [Paludibacteraceae bacterium]